MRTGLLAAGLATAFSIPAAADDAVTPLQTFTIEAARTGQPVTSLPYAVTVIERAEIEQQLALGGDIAQLLGNLVPSYSPSRQKLSGFGETLRGREPLFMIDGVPQSNPLRNGSRDGYTIDPGMIERIEIILGANAIQGTGATGGIINIITRTSAPGQAPEARASVQAGINDDFSGESFGTRAHAQYAASSGNFDYLAAAGYTNTGMYYDAEDRPIGVDNTQGDTMDGKGWDAFFKAGYNFGAQRTEIMFNHFEFASDGEWITVPGDIAAGIPATSQPGSIEGEPAENDVNTVSFKYSHAEFGPGRLDWQLFRQDFAAIYGAGTFGVFSLTPPPDTTPVLDQSRNLSEKLGSKLTYNLPGVLHADVDATLGFDWLRDTTEQDLIQTGRSWVPETTYVNWAPFAQLNWRLAPVQLTAGVRRENARLDVNDFTTLAFYNNTFVAGGSPEFDETLTNLGANWRLNDYWTLYAARSEGFNMPDVGRVLRGINTPDLDVDSFLNLQPVVADNREFGVQFRRNGGEFRIAYFESESDLGSRLVPDADGIFSVQRERTEIDGIEADGMLDVGRSANIGFRYAMLDGRYDSDGDNRVDTDLDGINIAPDRLNLYWEHDWSGSLSSRLQANILRDREFRDASGAAVSRFAGYTTLDAVIGWQLSGEQQLQFGIENLLDKQYITYYSQVYAFAGDDGNFAGRGRNLYVTWRGSL